MRALLAVAAMLSLAAVHPAAAQAPRAVKAAAGGGNGGGLPALHTELQAETTARVNADAMEMANRTNADANLQEQITQLQTTVANLPSGPAAPTVVGSARIDGVSGETKSGDTAIYSFSMGEQNSGTIGTPGGGGAGKVTFQDVAFTIMPGAASTDLLELVATGKHVKVAVFTMPGAIDGRPPRPPYREVKLEDLLFTSAQAGAPSAPESYSINFAKITVKYVPASGAPVQFCFDIKANKSC